MSSLCKIFPSKEREAFLELMARKESQDHMDCKDQSVNRVLLVHQEYKVMLLPTYKMCSP